MRVDFPKVAASEFFGYAEDERRHAGDYRLRPVDGVTVKALAVVERADE